MKHIQRVALLLSTLAAFSAPVAFAQEQVSGLCAREGVQLQVLGSGGPFSAGNSGRASSGYLLWIDGVNRLMVDAGGGTFNSFGAAGATVDNLSLLALSHFHPDHSAELPALLWPLTGALRIAGPTGTAAFPSVNDYLEGLFGPDGVFRVLSPNFQFATTTIDVAAGASEVLNADGLVVRAQGVPHGDVPTLAYRAEVGDISVVFSSDQNGTDPTFVDFARGADLLIVHFAGNEDGSGRADLHAKPSVWGQIARDAGVGELLLSHLIINQNYETNLEALKTVYSGPLRIAEDMMCLALD